MLEPLKTLRLTGKAARTTPNSLSVRANGRMMTDWTFIGKEEFALAAIAACFNDPYNLGDNIPRTL
jgi:hypothetical protein